MIKKEYPIDVNSYPFAVSVPIQIRFSDIDSFGHANNCALQSFFDLGRSAYLERTCGTDFQKGTKTLLVVSYTTDFMRQVRYGDSIEVRVAVCHIGKRSIRMIMVIADTDKKEIFCICDSVMSGFDRQAQTSTPILPEWRDKISHIESRSFE